ncbi:DUF3788 family protein [Propionicimonas paludicola]|nr:DUF3788 family protein [Propionicimonas paludicola]
MGQAFRDQSQPPTPEAIAEVLGDTDAAWQEALDAFANAGVDVAWRYYRDGGWLAKATRGKATMAWMSVEPGLARITFYFPARLRETVLASPDLDDTLRERVATTAPTGKSLPVTLRLPDVPTSQVPIVLELKQRLR